MDSPAFPFSDDELNNIGVLGEGVPKAAAQALDIMRKRPDLFKPSLFALQCASLHGQLYRHPSSPTLPSSRTFSDSSMTPNFPALTVTSEVTLVSEHGPDAYERMHYYNGITGNDDCPELVYRSDALTTPFPKQFSRVPAKSVHGAFDTPLYKVWDTIGPQVRDIIKANEVQLVSTGIVRFFKRGLPGDEENGSLGPVVIWIGVRPGSTSVNIAHNVSQLILALLLKNKVEGVVVEWKEVVGHRLDV